MDVICILQIIHHWSFMIIENIVSQILYYISYLNTQICIYRGSSIHVQYVNIPVYMCIMYVYMHNINTYIYVLYIHIISYHIILSYRSVSHSNMSTKKDNWTKAHEDFNTKNTSTCYLPETPHSENRNPTIPGKKRNPWEPQEKKAPLSPRL